MAYRNDVTSSTLRDQIDDASAPSVFRDIPYMGVIYVVAEGAKLGYTADNPDWCNLGQGQPEVGPLPGAPDRQTTIRIEAREHAYAPVQGTDELRSAIANLYNRWYRQGKPSKYGPKNVAISAGGRLALSRAGAALGDVRLGHFVPDYSAYEDLLHTFERATPVRIELDPDSGFAPNLEVIERRVAVDNLRALLISNPCNPTGHAIVGDHLAAWVAMSRRHNCTLLLDEFYSQYSWGSTAPVSAAQHVEDVEEDPVLMFDGLTKGYRYPGWRLGWTIGPSRYIETIAKAASFLDGGPPHFLQRAALDIVRPDIAEQEGRATRAAFRAKRELMIGRLRDMGIKLQREPEGTFYAFGSIADLPEPFNESFSFFRSALQYKVLTVPGPFFDIRPRSVERGPSVLTSYIRFSFGPPMETVRTGLDRLSEMLRAATPAGGLSRINA